MCQYSQGKGRNQIHMNTKLERLKKRTPKPYAITFLWPLNSGETMITNTDPRTVHHRTIQEPKPRTQSHGPVHRTTETTTQVTSEQSTHTRWKNSGQPFLLPSPARPPLRLTRLLLIQSKSQPRTLRDHSRIGEKEEKRKREGDKKNQWSSYIYMPETTRRNERDGEEEERSLNTEEEERGRQRRGTHLDRIVAVRCGARVGSDGGRCDAAGVGPAQTESSPPPNFLLLPDNLPPVSTHAWTGTDTDRWGHLCFLSFSFCCPVKQHQCFLRRIMKLQQYFLHGLLAIIDYSINFSPKKLHAFKKNVWNKRNWNCLMVVLL